ncbi:carboxypeptidase regulatory-like domain-containing protein [Mucilaginibacter hurinus]|uniref:Carboxypeptidase regulatory-like domain-containing protein n=1 Tax=Mucilaginibacter hurinus TaxID=2201324 RepID=A0A367GT16_9SPHI|nr:carboxypeptidase-like regulatory domain-containing protein [Mucilaginibacter hurinus]RCH55986.1 carboxypeptidase regulatory-like domain-containing protein [Mucilaginibacter hurinus]
MKLSTSLFLSYILLSFCSPVFAQRDSISLNTIVEKANQLTQSHPIEKVYLHLDKPYYATGDTIWYKAYLTFGLHQPSELSKIVYVDIINSRDQLIASQMLSVKEGTAIGSIALTQPQFVQDSYHIRAYTKWMMNFDKAYYFNKTVVVGNAINKPVNTAIILKRTANSNNAGVNTIITYKDSDGNPLADKKVQWTITDNGEDLAKGKASTDAQGKLFINFPNTASTDLSSAVLNTVLDAGNHKEYSNSYPLKSVALPTDVQFFPEGGNFINGLRSKIAVKAVQPNGLGIDFTAVISDNTGATVTTCNSQHRGMGLFVLTPEAGKTYKAEVNFKDGTKDIYELPVAQTSGIIITAGTPDTANVYIKIAANESYLKSHLNKTYYLVAKTGQVICYAAKIKLTNPDFSAAIPANKFPTGIAQLTLMTSFGQPLSERLVFINRPDKLNLSVITDKKVYSNRKKVTMSVNAKNAVAGVSDLSVAVINETKVPVDEDAETTILSNMLLTSDIKGYVESPNYYFKGSSDKTASDLDLLMLTQGYRRFTYTEMLKNKIPQVNYFPEQGIELSGILRTSNGLPVKGGTVTLQIPSKYYTTRATTDAEGRFRFPGLVFADSAKIVISAKGNYNAKNMMVTVDGSSYPAMFPNPDEPDEQLNIDTKLSDYLVNSKKIYESSRQLQEVVIKAKAITKPGPSYRDHSALTGLSMPDHQISGDRFKGCNIMLQCLQGTLPGVTYDANTAQFYLSRSFNSGGRIPMALYVSGMPVDVGYLNSLNSADLASIEVFTRDELGMVNRAGQTNGVLAINMKVAPKGTKVSLQDLEELIPQAHTAKITPMGYTIPKTFYSPKYTPTGNGGAFGPDLRTTIYWNPRVNTEAGKATFDFFTADGKGSYRTVVEGIDKDGRIGRVVYRFKVE